MSNFSNIGFGVAEQDEFAELVERVYSLGKQIQVHEGAYVLFADPSGAELWLQVNNNNELIGMNPHYSGKSARKVAITAPVSRSISVLDGAYHAWADPKDDQDPESGEYPFVFDLPNLKTMSVVSLPAVLFIQLTAFAQDIDIYDSEDVYYASQNEEYKFASRSFIPSGLFNDADNGNDTEATCFFTGIIKEYKLMENKFTGNKFYWLLADTLGGETDIVANVEFFKNEPVVGGVIQGSFWLSGCIIKGDKPDVKENFFQKLFKKK